MATQVNTFEKSDATNTDKSSSIFFMWIGVNDMKLLFENHRNDTSERREILVNDINSIKNDLYKIKDSGAKYIVMMGLIPLQEVPMYYNTTYDATARDNLKQLVNSYNIKLKAITRKFASKHKQTNILFFDSYNQFYKMYDADTIAKNNLMNCNKVVNCDNYIWWDNLHPSGMTHKKIATAVFDEISKSEW
ncbi:uncharacterized protein B0P05DRAFT_557162 [Gilbertella persicaria]|uniref:uncharacterized protein n=1 Tax=Gilbertella persicaria TaxID=101096 RepID=UPI002220D1B4|nr:uncharacterized protein B0P05DRAFT_557162 [Gilbertella persicaria]KAI8061476.1 hypothetical protein B0P05DRAFT_557162 [Gilbertella persicaria]